MRRKGVVSARSTTLGLARNARSAQSEGGGTVGPPLAKDGDLDSERGKVNDLVPYPDRSRRIFSYRSN